MDGGNEIKGYMWMSGDKMQGYMVGGDKTQGYL